MDFAVRASSNIAVALVYGKPGAGALYGTHATLPAAYGSSTTEIDNGQLRRRYSAAACRIYPWSWQDWRLPRTKKTVSDILTIDYATLRDHVILRGEAYGFHSDANGRHQLTPFGTRIVTSSKQGWAFEVDAQGKIVSSFVNRFDDKEGVALHLSDAWRLPDNYFEKEFWRDYDV